MSTRNKSSNQRYIAYGAAGSIILLTFLILFLLPDSPSAEDAPDSADPEREVNVRNFEPGEITTDISITGRVRAVERIEVFTEVQGVLISGARPFRTGNRFEQGDVLVQLDNTDEELDLFAQRSRFQSALASLLPTIRSDYSSSFDNWAAYVESFDPESSLNELPEPESRQERFFLAANDIYGQYYSIKAQENRISKFTLRAPFSGELRSADAFPGTLIQPNTSLGEFIGDVYELETFVSLSELDFISAGDIVRLRSAGTGLELEGTIARIGSSVNAQTQSFPVYIEMESERLKDGLYLEGTISGRTLEDVVEIPRNLLTRENTVLIIEDDIGTHREVEPLFFNRETVLVRGLQSDDDVIELRAGTTSLAGARVRKIEE
ncbi:MAG: efflux RND transporter periplasmic adaptor subunit [Balneolia bacterium]|nr:efflux RND transporter periplasmic adaptor subunit [Balneolia bacterium]